VAIVAASWHEAVMAGLIDGARRVLAAAGARVEVIRVPGSFELPLAAQAAIRAGAAGAVALGAIVRGDTPHFEYVAQATAWGLGQVALATGRPVGFGVLTCDDIGQALDRAGLDGSAEDKGAEAAAAVLAMVATLHLAE
jgi:6,7-dimethyl-8-ribityllumazine synthase